MMKICIYHNNCNDGMASAAIVKKYYGDDIKLHPGVYGQEPPDVTDMEVIMVDFSYKRDVLLKMAKQAKSILDHHKTAEAELVDLPSNVTAIFDMHRSGCGLAWEYFYGNTPPYALQLVEDRDLWHFKYQESKNFYAYIQSRENNNNNIKLWELILDMDRATIEEYCYDGELIKEATTVAIKKHIEASAFRIKLDGHDVPTLWCPPAWMSEAGHIMAHGEKFSVLFNYDGKKLMYSLRSAEDGLDVGEIATKYGGGGHKHAAGFTVEGDRIVSFIMEGKQ